MTGRVFADSNVLIYAHDVVEVKREFDTAAAYRYGFGVIDKAHL
jgi:hypothetical protein